MADPRDLVSADTVPESSAGDSSRDSIELGGEAERYREEGLLGRGGMGVVSEYFDRRIGRRVAWKELRRDVDDRGTSRARFLREARVQGQLEHPAIVPVYDLDVRPDGAPYFTMKTVRGVTLADVFARLAAGQDGKTYAAHRLLSAFSRICLAVEFAHEHGVVHRDLKPANLILGEYGEVYVLDWGLAKLLEEREPEREHDLVTPSGGMTSANALLGTPGYMAPEQIDDPSRVGPAADVYALGAILFELLALEPLHERGLEALHTTRRGVEARPSVRVPARSAPLELEAAIVRATALDPASRGTPRQLSEVIDRYLEGERDLELRRTRAAEHARAAEQAVAEARAGGPLAHDARRRAMQEINRALVLDPGNASVMARMAELLALPLDPLPPELAVELRRKWYRDMNWVSSVGAAVYLSMIGFVFVMWWMGIRQPGVVAAFFALMIVSGVLSVIVARSREPNLRLVAIAVVTSCAGFAMATRIASPLVLVPGAIAINATGYAVLLSRGYRWLVMAASSAALLVPLVLELVGVIPPTFTFDHGRFVVLPVALAFPAAATVSLLALASVSSVFLGTMIIGHIRDRLADAERREFLYAWNLRELVPAEVRTRTDPGIAT